MPKQILYGFGNAAIRARIIRSLMLIPGHLYIMSTLAALALGAGANEYRPPSSEPRALFPFGSHVYFSADDGMHGRELWRADVYGHAEFIKDISPGPAGTEIDQFLVFQNLLYFRACKDNGDADGEIWRTDGTEKGTISVLGKSESGADSGVSYLSDASSQYIYFARGVKGESSSMWYSDGTFEGTHRFSSPEGGALGISTYSGIVWGDRFVFSATSSPFHYFVWCFDESTKELTPLTETLSLASDFTAFSETELHFSADDTKSGTECWVTGGTPETTRMLKDIYPGPESSNPGERFLFEPGNGKRRIVFSANHPETGREIWETDGTEEGTRLFADLLAGAGSSNPYYYLTRGDYIYFIAMTNNTGKEPWGYVEGEGPPRMLADLYPGPLGSDPYALCIFETNQLFFSALTPDRGEEPWRCASPLEEPVLLKDFITGPASSFPYYSVPLDSNVVFAATGAVEGREVWLLDSHTLEVTLLSDIKTDTSYNPSSHPQQLTVAGPLLFFAANDIAHGNELWCSDGSTAGTRLVKDIFKGRASSEPSLLTAVGNLLYFVADDGLHGAELWRSDGTPGGTAMTKDISFSGSSAIGNLTRLGENLLFSAQDDKQGLELWILEPGKQPRILRDINVGPGSSSPEGFTVFNGQAYFRANDGLRGEELWRTNGTNEGTMIVRDIVEAPYEATSFGEIALSNGTLFVSANISGRGAELWKLREKDGGFQLVADIASPSEYHVLVLDSP